MPLAFPLISAALGAGAGLFGGLFVGDTAKNISHILGWVALVGIIAFLAYMTMKGAH